MENLFKNYITFFSMNSLKRVYMFYLSFIRLHTLFHYSCTVPNLVGRAGVSVVIVVLFVLFFKHRVYSK